MAARDGIGAPRRPAAIEREQRVVAEADRLSKVEKRGLRYEDAARVLEDGTTRKQINYTLERLARAGKLERRDGYVWYLK